MGTCAHEKIRAAVAACTSDLTLAIGYYRALDQFTLATTNKPLEAAESFSTFVELACRAMYNEMLTLAMRSLCPIAPKQGRDMNFWALLNHTELKHCVHDNEALEDLREFASRLARVRNQVRFHLDPKKIASRNEFYTSLNSTEDEFIKRLSVAREICANMQSKIGQAALDPVGYNGSDLPAIIDATNHAVRASRPNRARG